MKYACLHGDQEACIKVSLSGQNLVDLFYPFKEGSHMAMAVLAGPSGSRTLCIS
jgi:hypothetical protein